ncbi:lantibiotic dehydratase [Acrocarpospora sp. B8E8]|uniref:lantibiotic dehydratase n=1 Tax=Acrocarpospora sp. B8E8 TaxID=3153572 RepID=UPI00325F7452
MTVPTRYQHAGLVLVRATTDPGDLDPPVHLNWSDSAAIERDGRNWLSRVWSRGEVREALQLASPVLAARVTRLLDPDAASTVKDVRRDLRRVVVSVASYLLRWQRRATPFGMFAGVTAAGLGPTAAKVGAGHRALARADAEWLTTLINRIERHPGLRPYLMVAADSSAFVRDGRLITIGRADVRARVPGPLREISVRYTRPVQIALTTAANPIQFETLTALLATRFPAVAPEKISSLVHALVDQGFLITNLRPPMTAVDGLTHLLTALRAAGAERLPDFTVLLEQLEEISDHLARHNRGTDPQPAAELRSLIAARMAALATGTGSVLAIDMRLDGQITLPEPVLAEAELAASVLLRLTSQPFGSAAFLDYHSRFRTRYGVGALVPVRELVADSGLGYPGGYLGAPRARPAWRMLTDRDAALLSLIQKATLDGAEEIELTDADIAALTVGDHTDIVAPQRIELGVALRAASAEAIDRGAFELWVTAAPRAHTSMAGRFAPLLDEIDRDLLAATYTDPHPGKDAGWESLRGVVNSAVHDDVDDTVVAVQLSFPPRRPHNENVVRVPRLLPDVVSLAEHPDGDVIDMDDLAVTADAHQMFLVQRSTGRRVVPRIPHALDTSLQTPPLARFLAEVADARSAVFGPVDMGAARTLPYLPRLRYRRTVLAAARWILTVTDLPDREVDARWEAALNSWRRRWKVPARVVLCHGELRLPLNLDHGLDGVVLRARLERAGRIELQEAGPPHGQDWIGRPAELLIPMTAINPPPRRLPVTAPPGALFRPGDAALVHAQLAGNPARFDEILTSHLPAFVTTLGDLIERWWVRRHRDLILLDTDQHLALLLRLTAPEQYGAVAARLAAFSAGLAARGLPAQLTLVSHSQHPGRYGDGPAVAAAEQVSAADTTSAIAQINVAAAAGVAAQALAAASMADLAAAFAPDPVSGCRALLRCLKQEHGPLDRPLRDLALSFADPTGDLRAARALPGGDVMASAWLARRTALTAYHRVLAEQRDPATVLRTLLHEHHIRALGVDPSFEKATGRLARAVAQRRLALAGAL